jgi:hypothetical protein
MSDTKFKTTCPETGQVIIYGHEDIRESYTRGEYVPRQPQWIPHSGNNIQNCFRRPRDGSGYPR